MQVSLLQENFNTALSHVSRFVSSKAQLPILNNILVSTDQGRLKLSATNLELGINYWLGAKVETDGSFSIPAHDITEFVSYLPAGKLDLNLNDNSLLTLTAPKAESTFTTTPPSDFPSLPSINLDSAFEINSNLLLQSVSQVAFAAAADDSRPILTAILCQFTPDNINLVATDGFRLSQKQIKLVNPISLKSDQLTVFIPAKTLSEITKLSKNDQKIKIGLTSDEHQIVFVLDNLELVSRLLEGDYPDYHRIIPESYNTKIYLNRSEFAQSIKIASVFARQSANVVRFNIKGSSLELTANAPQIGQNKTELDARIEGEPLEIAFNYKFITDFLNIAKGDEIVISLNESLTPGLFQDQSDPSFTHIIMPVRIQD